jgi:hypothetical protein
MDRRITNTSAVAIDSKGQFVAPNAEELRLAAAGLRSIGKHSAAATLDARAAAMEKKK